MGYALKPLAVCIVTSKINLPARSSAGVLAQLSSTGLM